jgi:beta-barrel assembly-enhancing protease
MQSFMGVYTELKPGGESKEATILVLKKSLKIGFTTENGEPHTEEWMIADIQMQYLAAEQETAVSLNNTTKQIRVPGDALYMAVKEIQAYQALPRHKRIFTTLWYKQLTAALIILTLLVGGYFILAPWLSGLLAKKLPRKYEISLGTSVYNSMMKTYNIDTGKTALAQLFFAEMRVSSPYPVQVTVVNSRQVNAFALPGGHIVIYTALLEKMKNHAELAALLAHEFSHINNRHATRSLFRKLGSKAFLSLLLGRTAMLTSLVLDNADNLKSLKYSRSLEKEADLEGLRLLNEKKIDARGFIWLMEHLAENGKELLPEIITSHPNIRKRIEYLRESSNFVPQDTVAIKALPVIFDQLVK